MTAAQQPSPDSLTGAAPAAPPARPVTGGRAAPRRRRRFLPGAALTLAALLTVGGCGGGRGKAHHSPSPGKPSTAWDTRPSSLAALGDSITVGFDACTVLSDCPQVSWATGTDPKVDSLAQRLVGRGSTRAERHSWNLARTGAVVADLPEQVEAAVAHRPRLVTVLIGANDACRTRARQMTPVATFRRVFQESLAHLRRDLPHTEVYVAGVPDLMRLWEQGRANALGKEVWKLGICQSMLHDPDNLGRKAAGRRKRVEERVVAYNTAMREVCEADTLCRFDSSVFDYRFTGRELSQWDWFHPNTRGQHELASLAYRAITRRG